MCLVSIFVSFTKNHISRLLHVKHNLQTIFSFLYQVFKNRREDYMKIRLMRQIDKDAHHFRELMRHQEKQFFADQVVRKNLNPFRLPRLTRSNRPHQPDPSADGRPGLFSELTSSNLKVSLFSKLASRLQHQLYIDLCSLAGCVVTVRVVL